MQVDLNISAGDVIFSPGNIDMRNTGDSSSFDLNPTLMSPDSSSTAPTSGLSVNTTHSDGGLDILCSTSSNSTDDDLFPLPVEVRRTNSFPCIPGSEENQNAERGIDIQYLPHQQNVPYFSLNTMFSEKNDIDAVAIEKPQLRKSVGDAVKSLPHFLPASLIDVPIPPFKPFHLVRSHFTCDLALNTIIVTIDNALNKISGVSSSHDSSTCLWESKCSDLLSCNTCLMDVQIYKTSVSGNYIVEANRVTGDHDVFHAHYSRLRAAFFVEDNPCSIAGNAYDSFACSVGQLPPVTLDEMDAKSAIEPVLCMIESNIIESQIEASRILYDLVHNEDLLKYWCDTRCMHAMIILAHADAPDVARHNVFMTLAQLASKRPWQELIIEAGALPVIMTAVCNGGYETAELRRESARTFEFLSTHLAHRIASKLGNELLQDWFVLVDDLDDERLRLHAMRARDALRAVYVK